MSDWPGTPDETFAVAATDGVELVMERFDPSGPDSRALIFIHGIGNYPGPYRRFARALADAGTTVYLPHLRGHGSSGTRGVMGSPKTVLADIASMLERVRADAEREIVLGGESMGGLFALAYAASAPAASDRLLLLSPALWPDLGTWFDTGVNTLRIAAGATPEEIRRSMHAPIYGEPARSEEFRQRIQVDPNVLQEPSFGYLLTIARLMLGSTRRYPRRITEPCLIMQAGADRVLDSRAAHTLATRMPNAEFETIPDAWHNVLWDPTAEATTARVAEWLARGA